MLQVTAYVLCPMGAKRIVNNDYDDIVTYLWHSFHLLYLQELQFNKRIVNVKMLQGKQQGCVLEWKNQLRKAQLTKKVGKQRNRWEVNRRRMKLEKENEKPQILQSTFHWSSKKVEWMENRWKIDQIEMGQIKYNQKI